MPHLPLSGLRVLVTRSRSQTSHLSARLRDADAEPIEAPLIQIMDPKDWAPLDRALADLDTFDWLIFTSVNAVDKCVARSETTGVQIPTSLRIAAVGAATVKRLQKYGLTTDYHPDRYDTEALVEGMETAYEMNGVRILFPCADIARQTVVTGLTELGAEVTPVTAYRTVPVTDLPSDVLTLLRRKAIHVVTFTSSSTVNAFVQATQDAPGLLSGVTIACIGPVTARTAEEAGMTVDIVPGEATIEGLVEALEERMGMRQRERP